MTRSRAKVVEVWDEFGNAAAPADGKVAGAPQERQREPQADQLGCPAAQQWLTALAQWCEGAEGAGVKQELTGLLRCGSRSKDKVWAVANMARLLIGNVFSWTHHATDPPGADTPARARQCQYLFERALHGVLRAAVAQQAEHLGAALGACSLEDAAGGGSKAGGKAGGAGPVSPSSSMSVSERSRVVEAVLADESFQMGLVHACIEVVNHAYLGSPAQAFPWTALQLNRLHYCLELWQGIDWVCEQLEEPLAGADGPVPGMPEETAEYLVAIQVRIEEELAMIDGSSIYKHIVSTGANWTPPSRDEGGEDGGGSEGGEDAAPGKGTPRRKHGSRRSRFSIGASPDAVLMARFLTNLARTVMMRTCFVSKEVLLKFPAVEAVCPDLATKACAVMDMVLGDRLELLFGQHASVAVACALFYTIRVHGGSLPFRKLTALMCHVLDNHDETTFGRVEIPPADGSGWDGSRDYGDTRAWYNRVFLPAFAEYEPSDIFGEDLAAPTPSKAQLEAPAAEAADSGHLVPASSGQAGAKQAGAASGAGAGAVAGAGAKEARKLRRPLGQVTNSGNVGAGRAGSGVARSVR